MRRFTALLVASALAGVTSSAVLAAPAVANGTDACTPSAGVLVVVDFDHFGASIQEGCDANPSTGYNALIAAGFTLAGTQSDGPAFVCRIDGYPTPANDACVNTPPSSQSWSYWHANADAATWTYNTLGAAAYHPQPGSIDLWTFASTDIASCTGKPMFTPAQLRGGAASVTTEPSQCTSSPAPSPTATQTSSKPSPPHSTTAKPSARPRSAATPTAPLPIKSTAATHDPTHSQRPIPTRTPTRTPTATLTAQTPSPSAAASTSNALAAPMPPSGSPTAASSIAVVDVGHAQQARAPRASRGSPWPLILGLAIAATLAGTAFVLSRRRRTI